jgi:hypothetical protein
MGSLLKQMQHICVSRFDYSLRWHTCKKIAKYHSLFSSNIREIIKSICSYVYAIKIF